MRSFMGAEQDQSLEEEEEIQTISYIMDKDHILYSNISLPGLITT